MQQTLQHQNICQTGRNVMAIQVLTALGFEHANILRALSKLSGLTHADAARRIGVSRVSITQTLHGGRANRSLQDSIARVYGVPVEIMFPDDQKTTEAA